jgi:hypothetical protein
VNEVGTEQGLVAGNDDGFVIRLMNLQSDGGQLHNNEIKRYINLVELVSHMLDQIGLNVRKHQSKVKCAFL